MAQRTVTYYFVFFFHETVRGCGQRTPAVTAAFDGQLEHRKQRKEGNAKDGGECRRQKSAGGKKGKRAYPFRANICSFKIANLIARMYLSAVPLCWSTHRGSGPQTARREA